MIDLKSLRYLCKSEEISEQLKKIPLWNPAEDEDEFEEGLIPILTELIQRKNLITES